MSQIVAAARGMCCSTAAWERALRGFLLWGAISVSLVATFPAKAADVPDAAPLRAIAPLSADRWTGLYAGANLGGVWANDAVSWTAPGPGFSVHGADDVNVSSPGHIRTAGFTGGGQVGYNYQIQSIVLGAEADFGYAGISGSRSIISIENQNPYAQMVDSNWLATFRGRLGFVNGTWLGYVTGGFAMANVSTTDRFIGEHGVGAINGSADQVRSGWTAGAGVEWAFARQWTAKLEYLYVDLATASDVAVGTAVIDHDHSLTENIVRVGVNFRFN
jgi:outer membrane immunogenic protein